MQWQGGVRVSVGDSPFSRPLLRAADKCLGSLSLVPAALGAAFLCLSHPRDLAGTWPCSARLLGGEWETAQCHSLIARRPSPRGPAEATTGLVSSFSPATLLSLYLQFFSSVFLTLPWCVLETSNYCSRFWIASCIGSILSVIQFWLFLFLTINCFEVSVNIQTYISRITFNHTDF